MRLLRRSRPEAGLPMQFTLRTLLMATAIIAFLCVVAVNWLGPPIPDATVSQLHIGMAKQEVRSLLGAPNPGSTGSDWHYDRFYDRKWLTVRFGSTGRVFCIERRPALPRWAR